MPHARSSDYPKVKPSHAPSPSPHPRPSPQFDIPGLRQLFKRTEIEIASRGGERGEKAAFRGKSLGSDSKAWSPSVKGKGKRVKSTGPVELTPLHGSSNPQSKGARPATAFRYSLKRKATS